MPISDKTRKVLWGRSGNRCALCRCKLVVDATSTDETSIVGDECHIISGKPLGPRYGSTFPPEHVDEVENLILLCKIHHKMVDDQAETYTVGVLHQLKTNHEKWVASALAEEKSIPPVRVRRIKGNIPNHLPRIVSGQDLVKILDGVMAYSFDHDEPKSEEEVELLSELLQEAQDWGDLSSDLEAGQRVRISFRLTALIQQLESAGFWLFGGQEVQRIEGGIAAPSAFPVAILKVLRSDNPEIIKMDTSSQKRSADSTDKSSL